MSRVIGEYHFVFTDETTKGKSNNSLSSTTEDKVNNQESKTTSPINPQTQDKLKQFSAGATKAVAIGAFGTHIYQTVRDISYNRKSTSAIISGNTLAATHLEAKRHNQDIVLSNVMTTAKYAAMGAALGSTLPGMGTIIGAITGTIVGIATDMVKQQSQYREEMRRFMAELSEQRYSGYVQSRRLVNLSGGVR